MRRIKFVPFDADREREHTEVRQGGRDWWRCVPTAEAYLLASHREAEVRRDITARLEALGIYSIPTGDYIDRGAALAEIRESGTAREALG